MDRLIIRALRLGVHGIIVMGVVFVIYIVALLVATSRETSRMDEIEQRLDRIQRRLPVERP
jgi:AmiR/NasT family two-component response regulator